ncbi:MAG: PPC domain-containing protein [Anaerolineae bacterium]|nr:PPC domain-containing protein [Anaerolineae bacterium]
MWLTSARWGRIAVRWLIMISVITVMSGLWLRSVPLAYAVRHQQGAISISFGDLASGVLDDESFRQIYAFDGQAEDMIAITLARTEGDLDPVLLLTDEQGVILAVSDDDGPGMDARIAFTRLPITGRYFVIVTRFGQEHGSTAGDYTLLLERIGAGMTEDAVLAYGESVLGRVTQDDPIQFYFLRAQRGDVINVTMGRISGDLDPRVDLVTTDGVVLISNDDDPLAEGTLDAGISNYLVLDDDVYLIAATRFGDKAGDTEGNYVLSVSLTPPEALGASLDMARLIDYGMSVTGEISDEVSARYFRFDASRGDVVTITLNNESGNLDPTLKLFDAQQVELAQDENSGENRNARIAAFTIPRTGVYYLLATRAYEAEGQTKGEFMLELNGRSGVVGGRALEIVYGAAVSGVIDDSRVAEEYVFFGQEGDVITIEMGRTTGNLDSLVTLYDSDRKQIAFDDDGGGGEKDSLIERFVLPRDDMYILVASRFEREDGETSGAYMLSLVLVRAGN